MPVYVVDASVVIEYLVVGTNTQSVRAFMGSVTSQDRLVVPEFCLLECTNVVWKRVRFSGMTRSEATGVLQVLRALKLNRMPMKRLLDRSLEIGLDHSLAVYDSAYLALAQHFDCPLVTLDDKQGQAAAAERVVLTQLGDG